MEVLSDFSTGLAKDYREMQIAVQIDVLATAASSIRRAETCHCRR